MPQGGYYWISLLSSTYKKRKHRICSSLYLHILMKKSLACENQDGTTSPILIVDHINVLRIPIHSPLK